MEPSSEKVTPAPKISKVAKVEEEIQSLREESRRVQEAFEQATEMADRLKNGPRTQPDALVPPPAIPTAPTLPTPPPFNIDAAKDYQRIAKEEAKRLEALSKRKIDTIAEDYRKAAEAEATRLEALSKKSPGTERARATTTKPPKDEKADNKPSRWSRFIHRGEKPKKLSVRMNLINPRKGAMESPTEKIVPAPKISKTTKLEEEIQAAREESRRVEEAFRQATGMAGKLRSEAETLETTSSQSPTLKKDQAEAYQKAEKEATLRKLREKIASAQEEFAGIILDQNAKPFEKTKPEPSRNLLDLLNKARQGSIEHEDVYWHVFGGKSSSGTPYPASLVNRPDLLEKFAVGKNGEPYRNTRDAAHDLIEFLAKEAEEKMRQS